MTITRAERLLAVVTCLLVAYRIIREEWPVGLEVTPSEGD